MKKNYVSIVGTIISGRSWDGWFGKLCGADTVIKQIGDKGDVEVYINSPGGSVFAGFEIVNAFNAATKAGRKVDVFVSPLAASAASYISTAIRGATVHMAENAKLMFHAPWTGLYGSKKELEDGAELLDKLEDDIKAAIKARSGTVDETWFDTGRNKFLSTKEAIEMKLADSVGDPSAELVSFVSGQGKDDNSDGLVWAQSRLTEQNKAGGIDYELFAANVEFQGYLKHLCDEHYGEQTHVYDVTSDTFKVVRADGKCTLLNYEPNSLTIVAINWEASASDKENSMKNLKQPNDKQDVADKLPKAESDTKTPDTLVVEPNDKQDVADKLPKAESDTKTPDTPVVEPDAKKEPVADKPQKDTSGMSEDMIAFAKENYDLARAQHLTKIKACAANTFTDQELESFSISMLAKLSKLSDVKNSDSETADNRADNSIVPSPKGSEGTGGSLPPPEL